MLRWFPGLSSLAARSLRLGSLDGLRHVAGSLEELALGDTLKRLSMRAVGIWGFGSKRRNEAAQALLPLSPPPGASMAPWNDPGWDGIRHPTQT